MTQNNILVIIIFILLTYIALLPSYSIFFLRYQIDLEPQSYSPQPDLTNASDQYKTVSEFYLNDAEYVKLDVEGPESIAVSKDGKKVYFALKTGNIHSLSAPFLPVPRKLLDQALPTKTEYVLTCGRPLGITMDNDDNLVIADSVKGLLKFDIKSNQLSILTSSFLNSNKTHSKLNFVNDVIVGNDDMIYFTDSTSIAPILDNTGDWNTLIPSMYTLVTTVSHGKLLSYNPNTKETKVLMDGFKYSNGVAFDPKEESIFIGETTGCKVFRYWIKGANKGKSEVFIDNLPGYPDGVDVDFKEGKLYISIFGGRNWFIDLIHPYPILKNIFLRIPYLKMRPQKPSIVVADTQTGKILNYFQTSNDFPTITSTIEHNGKILIGNLLSDFFTIIKKK
ncbi:strictosidine synthase family protein [Dictyostelium discoideum AX4]|uniref:Strictosidine synthase family protein n=1 Tax=Dictyostelium discoideum TaxID=44689 RepID=Q54RB1_DICDI|nr:strictosidine synthase family protein [Dictyostelium discoideum AX4]EAL65781.1 strictosidine synthase family protein [Dictyostelium discoideum AX4]|eukprot:XP_639136.1 strictosidine synthase family protein [Dictyostelium discoideum AX4]